MASSFSEDHFQGFPERMPLLPLRDVVVYPQMLLPILVGRQVSLNAVEAASGGDKYILATAQKQSSIQEPSSRDIFRVGTISRIVQTLKLPNGTMKVLLEGVSRARIKRFLPGGDFFRVRIEPLNTLFHGSKEVEALSRSAKAYFEEYVHINKRLPNESLIGLANADTPEKLSYTIAGQIMQEVKVKQRMLNENDLVSRLRMLVELLIGEIELLKIEQDIEEEVKDQVQKNQKEFYLHEQIKAIRKELGSSEGDDELDQLEKKIYDAKMPEAVTEKATEELSRLKHMPSMSPEASVVRNYLDWLVALPWVIRTEDSLEIGSVIRILDEDHFGLEKVKERIVEFIAVLKLVKKMKGPILCLVGPPGVGKTSLGKSIARALDRKFVRISLGGVRDEAEIRGHRRTYIGSMPGRIIQSIRKAGSRNPVFLLDEVDKIGMDFRGDPASALLEVLDPEQNNSFSDHYLDVEFDLSEVLFVTTANVLHTVPPALRDRMETLQLPGYLVHEKLAIATGFLVPKQLEAHGLAPENIKFSEGAILRIIEQYTREAGVRNLEREIANVCRKVAKALASVEEPGSIRRHITSNNVKKFLGTPRFLEKEKDKEDMVGTAVGLAWTSVGGDILFIEVSTMRGNGKLILTGKLGDVMKESASAALSYIRSRAEKFDLDADFYSKLDIHVHIPEGAIPKDGPSAGITITTAMASALTGRPVRSDVAMTGEVTLRGRILPIGGLNEKAVAANRAGYREIIIPAENEKDLNEIPAKVKQGIVFHKVKSMEQVFDIAMPSTSRTDSVSGEPPLLAPGATLMS